MKKNKLKLFSLTALSATAIFGLGLSMTSSVSIENTSPETYYEQPEGETALDQATLESTNGIVLDEQDASISLKNNSSVTTTYDVKVQTRMSTYVNGTASTNAYTISVRVYMPETFDPTGYTNECGRQLMLVYGNTGDVYSNQASLFSNDNNLDEGATTASGKWVTTTEEGFSGYFEASYVVPQTLHQYTVSVYNEPNATIADRNTPSGSTTSYEYQEITDTENAVYTYTFFTAEADEEVEINRSITYYDFQVEKYSTGDSSLEYSFYIDLGSVNGLDLKTTAGYDATYAAKAGTTAIEETQYFMDTTLWIPYLSTSTKAGSYNLINLRTTDTHEDTTNGQGVGNIDNILISPADVNNGTYFVEVDIDMNNFKMYEISPTTDFAVQNQFNYGLSTTRNSELDYLNSHVSVRMNFQSENGNNPISNSNISIQERNAYNSSVNAYYNSLPETGLADWAKWTIGVSVGIVLLAGVAGTVAFARYEYKKHHKQHDVSLEHATGLDKEDKNLIHQEAVVKTTKKGGKK